MLRTLTGLSLVFVAFLFLYGAIMAIFVFGPAIFQATIPWSGGPIGAIAALLGAVWFTRKILRKSDHMLNPDESQELARRMKPPPTEIDWIAAQQEMARNKRWAYLRRTRQFDELAELEAKEKAAERAAAAGRRGRS